MGSTRNIVKEAVADAKQVRDLAIEAAKKKLVEQMTPAIKNLVEKQIRSSIEEDDDRLRRGMDDKWPGESHTGFEESKKELEGDTKMAKEKEMEKESLGAMFPGISEMEDDEGGLDQVEKKPCEAALDKPAPGKTLPDEEDELTDSFIPTLGEGEEGDEEEMEEDISIDEEGLKKAYEGLMKAEIALGEASVTKGFADSAKKTAWDTEKAPPKDKGVLDKGAEGKGWEETEPPAKQDYSVKEAIEKGLKENSELREYVTFLEDKVREAKKIIESLKGRLSEVNLFNTKVLHVNEMLNKFGKNLTNEQKKIVIEKIDGAATMREVKIVAEALKASFSTTQLTESATRRPKANAQRRLTSGAPDQKVLRESVDNNLRDQFARQRELAGLVS